MGIEVSHICDRCKANFGPDPVPPLNEVTVQVNQDSCVPSHDRRLICQPCFDDTWALVETYLKDTNGEEVAWDLEPSE